MVDEASSSHSESCTKSWLQLYSPVSKIVAAVEIYTFPIMFHEIWPACFSTNLYWMIPVEQRSMYRLQSYIWSGLACFTVLALPAISRKIMSRFLIACLLTTGQITYAKILLCAILCPHKSASCFLNQILVMLVEFCFMYQHPYLKHVYLFHYMLSVLKAIIFCWTFVFSAIVIIISLLQIAHI